MDSVNDARTQVVEFLRLEVVGPSQLDEVLDQSPMTRYTAGILFPQQAPVDTAERDDAASASAAEEQAGGQPAQALEFVDGDDDLSAAKIGPSLETSSFSEPDDFEDTDSISLASGFLPSAIGMSFLVAPEVTSLVVSIEAAVYDKCVEDVTYIDRKTNQEKTTKQDRYRRLRVAAEAKTILLDTVSAEPELIANGLAFKMKVRKRADGSKMVTAVLLNTFTTKRERPQFSECFFQAGFNVSSASGSAAFLEYRLAYPSYRDPEEQSLDLLYRNRRAFAVGHGVAASWKSVGDRATVLATSTIPAVELPPILPTSSASDALSMEFLGGDEVGDKQIVGALKEFVAEYKTWLLKQDATCEALPSQLQSTGRRHLDNCKCCFDRMTEGAQLLAEHPDIMLAFKLANRAMLMQQSHYKLSTQPRDPRDAWRTIPAKYQSDTERGRWRNFQLGFFLLNLSSFLPDSERKQVTDPSDSGSQIDPREIVDLIWFPTGGGKTEAYLGLAAFSIFLRRIRNSADSGCSVLMRYTLRLLTSQQFQRAASLICACEVLRASRDDLGTQQISLGLWIGTEGKRTSRETAKKALNEWHSEADSESPFKLLNCPWCGTRLNVRQRCGYAWTGGTVKFECPGDASSAGSDSPCPFSIDGALKYIPAVVIDEEIYQRPPAFIISTVDKFAMLAWYRQAGSILGLPNGKPPDLVIQDELHLISGPLGSMVGLYEAVIDLLCHRGQSGPKIIASTATIRNASAQCQALYDRTTSVFPPAALDVADSWFAKENAEGATRMYVGVMQTGASSPLTAAVRAASALLQAPSSLCFAHDATADSVQRSRDAFWTLVWYFNSKRELGGAASLMQSDIPDHLNLIGRRRGIKKPDAAQSLEERRRYLSAGRIAELQSSAPAVTETLDRLFLKCEDAHALDSVLCTNMISVGVDVGRLGLMLVNGQPKTTSEYIQASSRVGRAGPGLVVTMYNHAKPRDRSHYESFTAYHEAFYRFVEPTSVTPFSLPAMDRALHALLFIAVRHLAKINKPNEFKGDEQAVQQLRAWLKDRCGRIDAEHVEPLSSKFDQIVDIWTRDPRAMQWGDFSRNPPAERRLMRTAGTPPVDEIDEVSRPTPTSMRNVDAPSDCEILEPQQV